MEYKALLKKTIYKAIMISTPNFLTIKIACFVHIMAFVLLGGTLLSSTLFTIIMMYNVIRIDVAIMFPWAMVTLNEINISIKRIQVN